MCGACAEEYGADPANLPPETPIILRLIEELYALPEGGTGGPLHVALDDFNMEDGNWQWEEFDDLALAYRPETIAKAQEIRDRMLPLTLQQRASVVGQWWGKKQ
jgi:hypothetical protein